MLLEMVLCVAKVGEDTLGFGNPLSCETDHLNKLQDAESVAIEL